MKQARILSKKGYTGATALLVILNMLKVCSIVILCTTHTQHPEVPHNSDLMAHTKKIHNENHKPIC